MEIVGFQPVRERVSFVKALIYGPAGAGKTRFCADAPEPCWEDFESSTETLKHWPEYCDTPVKTPRDIDEMRRDIEKIVRGKEAKTIVFDSVTTALDYFMRQKLAADVAKPNSKRQAHEFWEKDYKYATQAFTDLFGFLQNAPINVVIIGHERVDKEKDAEGKTEVTGIYPDITPRLQQAVTRLVNVVGCMDARPATTKGVTRRLYLNRTRTIEAKNRLNIQDIYIENPTWKEIFGNV